MQPQLQVQGELWAPGIGLSPAPCPWTPWCGNPTYKARPLGRSAPLTPAGPPLLLSCIWVSLAHTHALSSPPHKWPPCGIRVEHTGRKVWGSRPHRLRRAVQAVRGLGVHGAALQVAVVWAPCPPHQCPRGPWTSHHVWNQSKALESSFPGPQAGPALSCGRPAATLPACPQSGRWEVGAVLTPALILYTCPGRAGCS